MIKARITSVVTPVIQATARVTIWTRAYVPGQQLLGIWMAEVETRYSVVLISRTKITARIKTEALNDEDEG